jgi:hypothetical protein
MQKYRPPVPSDFSKLIASGLNLLSLFCSRSLYYCASSLVLQISLVEDSLTPFTVFNF